LGGGNRCVFIKEVKEEINEGFLVGGELLVILFVGNKKCEFLV
jgi:hypothetical protein